MGEIENGGHLFGVMWTLKTPLDQSMSHTTNGDPVAKG